MHTSQTKPLTPDLPPAYNAFEGDSTLRTGSPNSEFSPPFTSTHPGYGPTPIAQAFTTPSTQGFGENIAVLPYYDPRSPYSIELAQRRARWRFLSAMACALGVWVVMGLLSWLGTRDGEYLRG